MTWLYKGNQFSEEMIKDNYGFVYLITNLLNGKMYVGRKYFFSQRTLPPLKGKVRKRRTKKPSDWKTYWSSSKILQEEIEKYGKENFKREILSLHPNKGETNYAELAEQVIRDVLNATDKNGEPKYYNENILTKFFGSEKFGKTRQEEHINRIQRCLTISPMDTLLQIS